MAACGGGVGLSPLQPLRADIPTSMIPDRTSEAHEWAGSNNVRAVMEQSPGAGALDRPRMVPDEQSGQTASPGVSSPRTRLGNVR